MISVGQKLPNAILYEFVPAAEGCSLGPKGFDVENLIANKKSVLFALPGAFTPTCSNQHLPGYVSNYDAFKAKGVDEIWCVSVNDAFVMNAWGKENGTEGKVRMFGDGSGEFTKLVGLELDLVKRGMGVRSQRYAMIVDNGVVTDLAVEGPGKFEVSNAETVLSKL